MKLQHTRPEDRRRQSTDSPAWVDTQPACFRSEGFAEDLHEPVASLSEAAAEPRGGWLRDATLPMLGVALAGVMGVFAR